MIINRSLNMKTFIKAIRANLNKKSQFYALKNYGIHPKVIFDVGTNKGLTIDLYNEHSSSSTIHAFEAIPQISLKLKEKYLNNSKIIIPNALDKEKRHKGCTGELLE